MHIHFIKNTLVAFTTLTLVQLVSAHAKKPVKEVFVKDCSNHRAQGITYEKYRKLVIHFQKQGTLGCFYDGMAKLKTLSGTGFVNTAGILVIPTNIEYFVDDFSEGFAKVNIGGAYGYINRKGKVVIPATFRDAKKFSGGMAAVFNESYRWGYINTQGNMVIKPQFKLVEGFSDDRAVVSLPTKSRRWNKIKYGVIDKTGNWVVKPSYNSINQFYDGTAVVKMNKKGTRGKFGMLGKNGKLLTKLRYDFASDMKAQRMAVAVGNKVAFLDTTGKEVIPPIYDLTCAEDFEKGSTLVKQGSDYFIIDPMGKKLKTLDYTQVERKRGKSWRRVLKNGKVGVIDLAGNEIIAPKFDRIHSFHETSDYNQAELNGKKVVFNRFGKVTK